MFISVENPDLGFITEQSYGKPSRKYSNPGQYKNTRIHILTKYSEPDPTQNNILQIKYSLEH